VSVTQRIFRAEFAKSIMENAIHASSTLDDAQSEIKLIFGDVEFEWDGTAGTDIMHGTAWIRFAYDFIQLLVSLIFSKFIKIFKLIQLRSRD